MTVLRVRTPAPGGASYSDAVVVQAGGARWIYVAGQTPRARPGEDAPPAHLGGQAERCFDQIERILHEHGATLADVVSLTAYLLDLIHYTEFAEVRARRFPAEPPSSAAVGVASLLDDALVEIVAVAVTAARSLG
jgi:enamine deaminase RidA (YjgF/YER057c/UK114 family)